MAVGRPVAPRPPTQRGPSSVEKPQERPPHLSLVSLLPHFCLIDDVNLSLKKYPLHLFAFDLEVNRQKLASPGFDRNRRSHHPFKCGNQSRGHGPCAAG